MNSAKLIQEIKNGLHDSLFADVYADEKLVDYQRERYVKALEKYNELYGENDVTVISVPGRSEMSGNHTDHQHGRVLACSLNLDIISVCSKYENVDILSDKRVIKININQLEVNPKETNSAEALVRGILAKMKLDGYQIGGFKAYMTSDVLIGSGMSSSAAFEVMIGNIISALYNNKNVDPIEIAKISQYSENVYFGKPCGLMDQMACSVGNLVNIDFKDKEHPVVRKIDVDFSNFNQSLCIVNTKGNHANLTDQYAAIPGEIKDVCKALGKEFASEITYNELMENIDMVRSKCSDRGVLRTFHVILENERVDKLVAALEQGNFELFKKYFVESGNSSYKYLQNVFAVSDYANQSVSIGIFASEQILQDKGVVRVHGGGFAGTIQAFVRNDFVQEYKEKIEKVFGQGSCLVLKVSKYGGKVVFE